MRWGAVKFYIGKEKGSERLGQRGELHRTGMRNEVHENPGRLLSLSRRGERGSWGSPGRNVRYVNCSVETFQSDDVQHTCDS